jgi:phage repressor protein C with HTH and peptisase S24 domain
MALLRQGQTVKFRPRGNSMQPRIKSGQLCTVEPATIDDIAVDDVVLCVVRGAQYLHLVIAKQGGKLLIGNNRGGTNGWIGPNGLYGKLVSVDD